MKLGLAMFSTVAILCVGAIANADEYEWEVEASVVCEIGVALTCNGSLELSKSDAEGRAEKALLEVVKDKNGEVSGSVKVTTRKEGDMWYWESACKAKLAKFLAVDCGTKYEKTFQAAEAAAKAAIEQKAKAENGFVKIEDPKFTIKKVK